MRIPYDVPKAAAIAYSLYATPGSGNPLPDMKDVSDSPRLTQPYYPPAADCVEYTVRMIGTLLQPSVDTCAVLIRHVPGPRLYQDRCD